MTSKSQSTSKTAGQARIVPVAERIKVTRDGGRIFVTITRRDSHMFGLSDPEARYLAIMLAAEAGTPGPGDAG